MNPMTPLLGVFGLGWLLAMLWLVLMPQLLQRLARQNPEAYDALGRPMMRWLWWSWPNAGRGLPPFLSLTGLRQGRVELQTLYAPAEIGSMLRLGGWILFNRPRLAVGRAARRLQLQLRLCALGFGLALTGVIAIGIIQPSLK
jgi:hypothetical protein